MITQEGQYINVCVRGIIIQDGELVITEVRDVENGGFLVGGRVDFGESLVDALKREMMEELGIDVEVKKLLYLSENIWLHHDNREFHEYGWYFLIHTSQPICPNGQCISNPDAENLVIRRTPLTAAGLSHVFPTFLRHFLPQDYAAGFIDCPRTLYSRDNGAIRETELASLL